MVFFQKSRLDKIETLVQTKDYQITSSETETLLFETVDFISFASGKYIDIVSNYVYDIETFLDKKRIKMCLKEMGTVKFWTREILLDQNKKRVFQKIEKIFTKIEALVDDVKLESL